MPHATQLANPIARESGRLGQVLFLLAIGLAFLTLFGCGGSTDAVQTSPDPNPPDRPPPPITTDQGNIFNVTIYSTSGQILVDKLEIEWNKRRGIHTFYGFHRDEYQELVTVPFRDLRRMDFVGAMPKDLFEQAIIGRESMNLRYGNAFTTKLTYWDGRQEEFYAIIPKFRGEKDLELWEFPMDNSFIAIGYIEFDR